MPKSLPDEYFRQSTTESSDVRSASSGGGASLSSKSRGPKSSGIPLWLALTSCLVAALVGLAGVQVVKWQEAASPSTTPTPSLAASGGMDLTPYDGQVRPVMATDAKGQCSQGGTGLAITLLDSRPDTIWRCQGAGVGETVNFLFPADTELVGVRIVNGDVTGQAYLAGRRIMEVRWTFADGSWAVQPLEANHPADQEVRFPPVTTSSVLLTVLSSTEPGESGTDNNAIAISRVEFLGRG